MALIIPPKVTELNASTYEEISMDEYPTKRDISLHTEDLSSFTIATSAAGANAAVIPAGLSVSFKNVDTHGPILYAKAAAGTPNLVLLIGTVS